MHGRTKGSRDKARRNISPASLANLRAPWRKGESGNPRGRLPVSLAAQTIALLTAPKRLKILKKIIAKATRGDCASVLLLARLERYAGMEVREIARAQRRGLPIDFAAGSQRLLVPAASSMDEVFDAARKAAQDAAAEPPEVDAIEVEPAETGE